MTQLSQGQTDELLATAVRESIADGLLARPWPALLTEAKNDEGPSRAEIAKMVRKILKHDLDKELQDAVQKALKAEDSEKLVTELTGRTLAKFFEILFTRRGTWQNQLKL